MATLLIAEVANGALNDITARALTAAVEIGAPVDVLVTHASAAEAATTFAATEATARRAFFTWTGNIHLQGTTHEVDVLGLSDRILGLLSITHGYEGEATRTTCELIHHYFHAHHFARLGEMCADVGFSSSPR